MIKKITKEDVMNLNIGDEIVLYGISANATVVNKKFFRVSRLPYQDTWSNSAIFVCEKIREDGSIIRPRYYWNSQSIRLEWRKEEGYFISSYSGTFIHHYIDPEKPCKEVIKRLQEEKRNINKKIMDCQNFMYKVE